MSRSPQSLVCVTTSAAFGGAETSLLVLLGGLRELEPSWETTVITPSAGPLLDRCRALGAVAIQLPFPAAVSRLGESGATGTRRRSTNQLHLTADAAAAAWAMPGYLRALGRELRGRRATLVHSNGLKAHVATALAVPSGAHLIWHLHEYVQPRPLTARLLRLLAHRTHAVVANSDSVVADARPALGGRARLRRVYNAVDLTAFRPDGPSLDLAALSDLPSDEGCIRIGLIATFGRWKGHDVFIEAIGRLTYPARARAYIIGGPVYETTGSQWSIAELRQLAAARGLSEMVGFTGQIADVPSALRSLDIVVHASTQPEPFGMVIAEGMASGRPVVAAGAGGAAELFEDGVTGMAFTPGDAGGLARVLDALQASAALRSRLGAAARDAASERFGPARMAAEFREAYLA